MRYVNLLEAQKPSSLSFVLGMPYKRRELLPVRRKLLGGHLKALRKRRKLTLVAVETATGVAVAQLSRYENGDVVPELPALLALAAFYEAPIDQIVSGADEGYDRVIARRLPLDARQIARAMVDAALLHATETLEAAVLPGRPTSAAKSQIVTGTTDAPGGSGSARQGTARKTKP